MKDLIINVDVLGMLQCNFSPLSFWEREDVMKHLQNHDINSKFVLQLLFFLVVASGMDMFFALFLVWQGI